MRSTRWLGVLSALGWFFFPLVPALLGSTCHQNLKGLLSLGTNPDPRDWSWFLWLCLTGPLIGYGFLAGATLNLPDDPAHRGFRGCLSKRSLWVAVVPWLGLFYVEGFFLTIKLVEWAYPSSREWQIPGLPDRWWTPLVAWLLYGALFIVPIAYGWLPFAWAALRRARRLDRLGQSLIRGLGVAFGFVGSLFGSFWAITETWRTYFFDPQIMPALLAASTLVLLAGCANNVT
jgi:hypothetical protein